MHAARHNGASEALPRRFRNVKLAGWCCSYLRSSDAPIPLIQGLQLAVEIGLHASAAVAGTDGNRICRFAFGGKNAWVKMRVVPKRDKCDRGRFKYTGLTKAFIDVRNGFRFISAKRACDKVG
jgi:hypothetical protein